MSMIRLPAAGGRLREQQAMEAKTGGVTFSFDVIDAGTSPKDPTVRFVLYAGPKSVGINLDSTEISKLIEKLTAAKFDLDVAVEKKKQAKAADLSPVTPVKSGPPPIWWDKKEPGCNCAWCKDA